MVKKAGKPPKFHHYVPRTYLKHWLDDRGLLYIYNKKSHTIRSSSINGQYFGKNDLNTITYPDNTKGYWIEQAFAEMEGTISPALNKVATAKHEASREITYDDKLYLSMFVSMQYWRLPVNKGTIDEMIKSGSFATIHSSIRNSKTGRAVSEEDTKRFYDRMSQEDLFVKAYPLMLALSKYLKRGAYDDLRYWHFYFQEPGFHITSDNPILYINEPNNDTIFMDFIMPLSPSVLLISSKNPPKEISANLSNALNILQICHSNQFVAAQNEGFLEAIVEVYKDGFVDKPLGAVEQYVYNEIFKP